MTDYVDSVDHEVLRYSYATSLPTERTLIATTPAPMGITGTPDKSQGVFDGLAVDGLGNVWVARWSDERIVGYTPEGEIICYIWTKGCKNPTIPCFGGTSFIPRSYPSRMVVRHLVMRQVVPEGAISEPGTELSWSWETRQS